MILSKILSKYQITLPKEAVKKLSLQKGDFLKCEIENGQILLKPVLVEEFYTQEELDKLEKLAEDPKNKGKIFNDVPGALKYLHSLR